MNDIRAIICGILAATALVCGTVLAATNADGLVIGTVLGLAGTFGGYVVGLYSSPYGGE